MLHFVCRGAQRQRGHPALSLQTATRRRVRPSANPIAMQNTDLPRRTFGANKQYSGHRIQQARTL
eukprot:3939835-Alexandrium_andersonii.AAC.1